MARSSQASPFLLSSFLLIVLPLCRTLPEAGRCNLQGPISSLYDTELSKGRVTTNGSELCTSLWSWPVLLIVTSFSEEGQLQPEKTAAPEPKPTAFFHCLSFASSSATDVWFCFRGIPWREGAACFTDMDFEQMDWNLPVGLYNAACAESLQLCLTLCDPRDYSPSGSSVHRILQMDTHSFICTMGKNHIFLMKLVRIKRDHPWKELNSAKFIITTTTSTAIQVILP
ncbi:hypothetical protein R6Z07F_000681 [Ovis aries]|nr:uncharacterized protein LOC121817627 [Ovis aries]